MAHALRADVPSSRRRAGLPGSGWAWCFLILTLPIAWQDRALAQIQRTPAESPIPFDYDVGRNIAVLDRERPELQATGLKFGRFTLLPSLDVGSEISSNVYSTRTGAVSDLSLTAAPAFTVRSNWQRHYLRLRGSGNFVRFAKEDLRDQDGWNLSASGIAQIGKDVQLYGDGGAARLFETRFAGATPENAASPVPFDRRFAAARARYAAGRVSLGIAADIYDYDFQDIRLFDGQRASQDSRDRFEKRASAQVAWRLNEAAGVFVQATWLDTHYDQPLPGGQPNRDSRSLRGLGGVSIDMAGILRGSLGLGYERRRYDAAVYTDISGLSVESQVELFLSSITTMTVGARRLFRDSNIVGSSGFVATGASLRIDHELFRYVLLYLGADYERDRYRGIESSARIMRVSGGGRYNFNRWLSLRGEISHGQRHSRGVPNGPYFAETRGLLSLTLQR
ncbi:outer membrane beta-barrel protein [Sphingobium sp. H39-3-25]|uniref:outer membrane beta-barrel protein n=1 Tax=Sphingobium arseniciresistens TaxID=3030834 RepID=UPI0023BA300B|nr:outer membrane beta-barrel protein [Sphingobium arseniciresistens]